MALQTEDEIRIEIHLTDAQALAFAQFLKRSYFGMYSECAVDQNEAYTMIRAGDRIRQALAGAGYCPR